MVDIRDFPGYESIRTDFSDFGDDGEVDANQNATKKTENKRDKKI